MKHVVNILDTKYKRTALQDVLNKHNQNLSMVDISEVIQWYSMKMGYGTYKVSIKTKSVALP